MATTVLRFQPVDMPVSEQQRECEILNKRPSGRITLEVTHGTHTHTHTHTHTRHAQVTRLAPLTQICVHLQTQLFTVDEAGEVSLTKVVKAKKTATTSTAATITGGSQQPVTAAPVAQTATETVLFASPSLPLS
jgi:hypothetical protein